LRSARQLNVEQVPLRIGEVARLAGVTTRTLRYWEPATADTVTVAFRPKKSATPAPPRIPATAARLPTAVQKVAQGNPMG